LRLLFLYDRNIFGTVDGLTEYAGVGAAKKADPVMKIAPLLG
jgi:hypothetical protein